jgi:redox-sensing transcriptional repressor
LRINERKKKINLRVIRRISFYYEALLKLDLPEEEYISSRKLEEITGVSCNQVRQDFFYLGISIGKQKKGYQVKKLFNELKRLLSVDKGAEVIVIGAGRLGRALAEFKLFKVRNIHVIALFDIKTEIIGKVLDVKGEKISIHHLDELEDFLGHHREVKIAMIAVPENAAQDVLDKLIARGIKGIVNFAPRILRVPRNARNIQLVNDCIGDSLYKIVYQIYHKK